VYIKNDSEKSFMQRRFFIIGNGDHSLMSYGGDTAIRVENEKTGKCSAWLTENQSMYFTNYPHRMCEVDLHLDIEPEYITKPTEAQKGIYRGSWNGEVDTNSVTEMLHKLF